MMEWNRNIDDAPRGRYVELPEPRGRHQATMTKFQPERILLSIIDAGVAKTVCTYRTEGSKSNPGGYWAGCSYGQKVLGWMPLPTPIQESDYE